jgi:hypothetical protein
MSQPLPPGVPNDANEASLLWSGAGPFTGSFVPAWWNNTPGAVKDLVHRCSGRSELGACRIEVVHDTLKPWRGAEGGGGDTGAEGDGTR